MKQTEIEQVMDKVIDDQHRGLPVCRDELARRYAHLMPELNEQLDIVMRITEAAQKVHDHDVAESSQPESEELASEEFQVLSEALSDYKLLDEARRGGQGVVYKALHIATERIVAIKLLLDGPLASEQKRLRFEREIKLASRLKHPNIVTIFDCGIVQGRMFYTMEFVDGVRIDDHIFASCLSVKEIANLFKQICLVINYAHQRGIIHRDLKPSNIVIDENGKPFILDFGLAKDLEIEDESESQAPLSLMGQVCGTLPYLSPEQARGLNEDRDVRTDIYSIGVVLYQMIAGCYPYPITRDALKSRQNILTLEPTHLAKAMASERSESHLQARDMDDDLEAIIFKALEKDPRRRYQSAGAFAQDLERYLDGGAVDAKSNRRFYIFRKTIRRYRWTVAIVAAFVTVLAGGLVGTTVMWQRQVRIARFYQAGLQMGAYVKDGSVQRDAGRTDQALEMWGKVIAIAESVHTNDAVINRYAYGSYHRRAQLYIEEGFPERAASDCDAAVAIAEEQVERDPASAEWQRMLAFSYVLHGDLNAGLKNFNEAILQYESVIEITNRLCGTDPTNRSFAYDLVSAHSKIGRSHKHLGQTEKAKSHYDKALSGFMELNRRFPDVTQYWLGMAMVENNIAALYISQHTSEDCRLALEYLGRAEQRLVEKKDERPFTDQRRYVELTLKRIRNNRQKANECLKKPAETTN